MTGFDIIESRQGAKVEMSANLQASLIKQHPRYDYRVVELTNERAEIAFYQDGEDIGHSEFTWKDAEQAGLTKNSKGEKKAVWHSFARNMLFSRAMTNGTAWFCPDLTPVRVYGMGEISGEEQAPELSDGHGGTPAMDPSPSASPTGEGSPRGASDAVAETSVEQVRTSTTDREPEEGEPDAISPSPSEGYDGPLEPPEAGEGAEGAVPAPDPAEGASEPQEPVQAPEQATLTPEVKMISHPQMKAIRAIAHGDLGWNDDELHDFAKVASTKELTHAQASDLIDALAIVAREKAEAPA
jgi:hypothetical protein